MATSVLERIRFGDAGARQTLNTMRRIVNTAIMQPRTVEVAHRIVRFLPARSYNQMACAIRDFVAQHFHFVPDPIGVELVRTPEYMLRQLETLGYMSGDCDDAAVIVAALAKSVGIEVKFIAVGFAATGPLRHVYATLHPRGGNTVTADVTRPAGVVATVRRNVEIAV